MSNAIRISHDGGGDNNFRLQASRFVVTHDRSPIAAPLPAANPILIDLGQWKVDILIEGNCSFTGTNLSDDGVSIADRDNLENMADSTETNDWHSNTITLTDSTEASTGASDVTYTVKVSRLRIEKTDAQNFWNYQLQLVGFQN